MNKLYYGAKVKTKGVLGPSQIGTIYGIIPADKYIYTEALIASDCPCCVCEEWNLEFTDWRSKLIIFIKFSLSSQVCFEKDSPYVKEAAYPEEEVELLPEEYDLWDPKSLN